MRSLGWFFCILHLCLCCVFCILYLCSPSEIGFLCIWGCERFFVLCIFVWVAFLCYVICSASEIRVFVYLGMTLLAIQNGIGWVGNRFIKIVIALPRLAPLPLQV